MTIGLHEQHREGYEALNSCPRNNTYSICKDISKQYHKTSVVVKDLRLEDEDKDKDKELGRH